MQLYPKLGFKIVIPKAGNNFNASTPTNCYCFLENTNIVMNTVEQSAAINPNIKLNTIFKLANLYLSITCYLRYNFLSKLLL